MARVAFPLVLQSPVTGSALVGGKATITKHEVGKSLGSGPGAEIFLTEGESGKVSGHVIETDNTGRWTQGEGASPAYAQYWVPEGRYDILISGSGLKSVYITRELISTEVLTSPVLTGTPTAPTAVLYTDTAQVATTAFVQNAVTSSKSIIATEQSRENTAYGTLTTPDEVTVMLPENGLISVGYQATWKESVEKAARAALFLGSNQVSIATGSPGSEALPQAAQTRAKEAERFFPLATAGTGLASLHPLGGYAGDVTTGQILGFLGESAQEAGGSPYETVTGAGGICHIFAAAGTYKLSIRFKASSGKVTVKNRKLWASVIA